MRCCRPSLAAAVASLALTWGPPCGAEPARRAAVERSAAPPAEPASAIDEALLRRDLELRRRRLADLHVLSRLELRAAERAEVRVALVEVLAEQADRLRIGMVPPGMDEATREQEALRAEDDGIYLLDAMLMNPDTLPRVVRDRAWFLFAELKEAQGDDRGAIRALRAVERTTSDPDRRARAAAKRGALLGRSFEASALVEAYGAHRVAFENAPSVANRLDLARAAGRVGHADEAIAHYSALVDALAAAEQVDDRAARSLAVASLARLLAERRTPEEAAAHIVAIGTGGRRVWRPLAISYGKGDAVEAMYDALSRARRLDPDPRVRLEATARLADAALRLDRRDEAARWVSMVDRALTELDPETPAGIAGRQNAELAMRRVIEQIYHDSFEAWRPADADRVLEAYLRHFGESSYAATVYYVRGVRRTEAGGGCAVHREAARDFRRAFDRTHARDPTFAAEAGLAMVRSLATCRGPWAADAPRPPTSPLDAALVSFGGRLLAIEPSPAIVGETSSLIGLALLAADELPEARAAFERALDADGDHLPTAAEHLLVTLELSGDLAAYSARAQAFADDARLPAPRRAEMRARLRDVALVRAMGIEGDADRARALMDFVRAHPDAPSARRALLAAAEAFGRIADWRSARLTLEDAVAREIVDGLIGDGHLRLAELAARQGRFAEAAAIYTRWLNAGPAGADDPQRTAIRAHTAALWRALDEPDRARAIAEPNRADAAHRLDDAIAALTRGDVDEARRLVGGEGGPAHVYLRACLDGDPVGGPPRGVPAERLERLRSACAPHRAEALLAEVPPSDTDGARGVDAVGGLKDRFDRLLAARGRPAAGELLRYQLVNARLFARYVGFAAQSGAALDDEARADVARTAQVAWALWRRASEAVGRRPIDGLYSARVGAALLDLIDMPRLEAP